MTEFIMVRHGEPDYSVVDEWAGIAVAQNFAPLTETTFICRDEGKILSKQKNQKALNIQVKKKINKRR